MVINIQDDILKISSLGLLGKISTCTVEPGIIDFIPEEEKDEQ